MGDTSKTRGNTTQKKGKMYWKFATLEGWRAKKDHSPAVCLSEDPETDENAADKALSAPDGPDQSAG